jgi:extradiol dioxygenase family protein
VAEPGLDGRRGRDRAERATAGLHRTIRALPVRDVRAAVAFYRERLGFESPHETDDFAVMIRDDAVLHLTTIRLWEQPYGATPEVVERPREV